MALTLNGSTGVTFDDSSLQGAAASPYVLKNRIINGDMVISQRAGTSVISTTGYTLDRWLVDASQASKFTTQQNAGAVTPPAGFTNYLGITSSSAYAVLTGDYFLINQSIEGYNIADLAFGTASAKTITISFWVRSSLTGTFGGSLRNAGADRSYPFSYTISVANTWEQKSVTIAGDTSGTWLVTNGTGFILSFSIGTGSTYSGTAGAWTASNLVSVTGATSVVGTNGATFYITGVQLEQNTSATPFERRLYNQELANCQRYTQVFGGNSNYNSIGTLGIAASTTTITYYAFPLSVQLRANPTVSVSGNFRVDDGFAGAPAVTSIGINGDATNTTGANLVIAVASGLTQGRAYQLQSSNSTASRLILSAEL
jgi:hypothetical protein